MEVYLTDDSGTLSATVFSPHFEKLTEFTPNQLYEADNKGQPLMKEVEAAIFGKKVFCFLKFFMAEKNYTVMQLYTEEAVLAFQTTEMHTDEPQSATHVVQQPTKETTEFFSPTTKAVLEEIADSVESKDDACIQPPHSKRTLMFGSIPTTIPTATPKKGTGSVDIPPMVHEVESPTKKMKNKEDNKEKGN